MVCSLSAITAEDLDWSWAIGSAGISYDAVHNRSFQQYDIIDFCVRYKNLWFSTNAASVRFPLQSFDTMTYSFFPVEIAVSPFKYDDWFYVLFYGRGEWRFGQTRASFWENQYGALGTRFLLVTTAAHYALSASAFIEYTTHNEVKIGVKMDALSAVVVLGVFTYAILQGNYHSIKEEKEKNEHIFPE
jgi:hypothetical protein